MKYLPLMCCLVSFSFATAEPAHVTAYDGDGAITVNGERTLIIGTYYHALAGDTRPIDRQMAELKEAGFNLVHTDLSEEAQQAAANAGLLTWVTVGTVDLQQPDESAQRLRESVQQAVNLPAVAFLETTDEPAWTWKEAGARVPAEALVTAYPMIKEIDPHHLLYTNHAPVNLVSTMQAYNAGTDIVAMDIYPVNPGNLGEMYALNPDGHQGDLVNMTLSQVGDYVDKMRRVAGPNRPVFMVLQGFAWEMLNPVAERDPAKVLYPTYEQSRFMAFQSLIKGANGIVYWGTGYTPQDSPMWADLKRAVREVADLAAPLAEPALAWPLSLDYHETGHSVDDGIQTRTVMHEGALYLVTCNADKNPCAATIGGLAGWKTGEVTHENRSIAVDNGALTDEWPPFGVHVYRLHR